jgi:MoxR-like ATPase
MVGCIATNLRTDRSAGLGADGVISVNSHNRLSPTYAHARYLLQELALTQLQLAEESAALAAAVARATQAEESALANSTRAEAAERAASDAIAALDQARAAHAEALLAQEQRHSSETDALKTLVQSLQVRGWTNAECYESSSAHCVWRCCIR